MIRVIPEPIYREIGNAIRARRKKLEKSQVILASELGLSRATVANIETGRQRLLVHQLYAVAAALRLDPGDLLPKPKNDSSLDDVDISSNDGDLNAYQKRQVANALSSLAKR